MKKFISLLLVLTMALSLLPMVAFAGNSASNPAAQETDPVIIVDKAWGKAGKNVTVNVRIKNNPGILAALLELSYDSRLTLLDRQSQ